MKMDKKILLMAAVVFSLVPQVVFAASGGGGLPWEGPLTTIQISLTGSVAISIALIAIAVAVRLMCLASVTSALRNFRRAGVLKNRFSTSMVVPGGAAIGFFD